MGQRVDFILNRFFYGAALFMFLLMAHDASAYTSSDTALPSNTDVTSGAVDNRINEVRLLIAQYPVIALEKLDDILLLGEELTDGHQLTLGLLKSRLDLHFGEFDKANTYLDKQLTMKLTQPLLSRTLYLKALAAILQHDGESALDYLTRAATETQTNVNSLAFEIDRLVLLARVYFMLAESEMVSSALHSARRLAISSTLDNHFCKVTLAQAEIALLGESVSLVSQHLSLFDERCSVKHLSIEQARLSVLSASLEQLQPEKSLALLILARDIYHTQQATEFSLALTLRVAKRYVNRQHLAAAQLELSRFEKESTTQTARIDTAEFYRLTGRLANASNEDKAALKFYKQYGRENELIAKKRLAKQSNYLTNRLAKKTQLLNDDIDNLKLELSDLKRNNKLFYWGSIGLGALLIIVLFYRVYRYFSRKRVAQEGALHV